MEKKPEKKDDLSIVNNVLKLATKLLKVSAPSSVHCDLENFRFLTGEEIILSYIWQANSLLPLCGQYWVCTVTQGEL